MTTTQETTTDQPDPMAQGTREGSHVLSALWELMRDVEWVGMGGKMDQKGGGGSYPYRKVEDVIAALGSRARVHGLALQSQVVTAPTYVEHDRTNRSGTVTTWTTCRGLVMRYIWTSLRDGSSFSAEAVGEGRDSADKATNKAMTAAYKYALTQATLLPTFDPDPDGERPTMEAGGQPQGNGQQQGGQQQGPPPDEPGPSEVLAAIRQASGMAELGDIGSWLEARSALDDQVEGQSFRQHLEAAATVLEGQQGGTGG